VGIVLTVTKYAVILAIIALAVVGAAAVFQPGLLEPLADSGVPVLGDGTSAGGQSAGDGIEGAATTTTSTATAASADTAASTSGATKRQRVENLIHAKVNEQREANELEPLRKDDLLREIARSHSSEMAQQGYFAHESPSGENYEDRYDQFAYNCRVSMGGGQYATGGENIWMMESSEEPDAERIATEAVSGWLNSPSHRENIMQPYWDDMGIGIYIHETGAGVKIYATQNFC